MKNRVLSGVQLAAVIVLLFAGASLSGPQEPPAQLRARAQKLFGEGNYREAYDLYRLLVLERGESPLLAGSDLDWAVTCLQSLGRVDETDSLRELAADRHRGNWRLLWRVAESYFSASHYGYIVGGEFHRGGHRGGGRYVNSLERDRVRAMQLMHAARTLAAGETVTPAVFEFHLRFAAIVAGYRGYGGAWRLQYLTDLERLPDYGEGYGSPWGGDLRAAPVQADGTPVYHRLPGSWEQSESDGERWRWLLSEAASLDAGRKDEVQWTFASFLHQQFGVQTLGTYPSMHRDRDEEAGEETGTFALHTLGDGETIARLAAGVRRFDLPEEYNFIRLLRELADLGGARAEAALNTLAQIYENRRQYPRAAAAWRESLERHGNDWKSARIAQIVRPWGQFEATAAQPAGAGAAVEYRFRNGRRVQFTARRIRTERLLADLKAYLRGNPRTLDRDRMNISRIGYRLVQKDERKYLGREAARWSLDLDPPANHFDRRVTVRTPLTRAGAYLLSADMEEGNSSRIVVWVHDTVIVRKHLDGGNLFYVADAVSGEPLPGVKVEFFGYDQEKTDWQKIVGRRYNVLTREFVYRTDGDGLLVPNTQDFSSRYRWLITAGTGQGRLAYLGWSGVWTGRRHDREYRERKVYAITDRPVYRPDQQVKFKLWVRHAQYDQDSTSRYAGQDFQVRIENPRSEKVFEKSFRADQWGGLSGVFPLPEDAALGTYRLFVPGGGGGTFRVEEYKKPEFEVAVEAPGVPVMLGETVAATIRADYYFGAPVTEAKVKYKVLRTAHRARWYPAGAWDWFYGPGYWWFSSDYPWYPGWMEWGLQRPSPWWWPVGHQPPEIVAEAEVPIGEGGKVEVRIDTAFAKEVHGDSDHRYEIIAEVTDRSRRTIVGKGEILVARRPFKVYAWVDRGHYRTGDVVQAEFSAQSLDRRPVTGGGSLRLLRIAYEDGAPVESLVREWVLDTDDEGRARLQIKAARAGQYRLSYRVTDDGGRTVEGGYLFTVRGPGAGEGDFRFNSLELVPDRREYAPGERARLMINTAQRDSTVLLFVRPSNGVYLPPRVLRLDGKSRFEEIAVEPKDMPNFYVEALTVRGGRVYTETREIVVPPEKRVLNVAVEPSRDRYRPGEKAKVRIRATDSSGRPFAGSVVLSVYDRAVEYISGGGGASDIRAFFWKWRRRHQPRTESSLEGRYGSIVKTGEKTMQPLGVFGHLVADDLDAGAVDGYSRDGRRGDAMKAEYRAKAPQAMLAREAPMEEASTEGAAVGADAAGPAAADHAEPAVRREFADTAYWAATLVTGEDGVAEAEFDMPENLTTWKMRSWVVGHGTVVGEGSAEAVTSKDLLVRLQSPRFFIEKDEVVLSANIHNYLPRDQEVRALLELDGGSLRTVSGAEQRVKVLAGGEERVDWLVEVVREGEATVRVKALAEVESDAVEMRFPVYVHGMLKTESASGVVRHEEASARFSVRVPAQRRVDQSRLEIRWSPSLAGAMVDALPYLVEYPYGCTEQTLNRFLPTVVTQKILIETGLDLQEIRTKRTNLNAQELGDGRERAAGWKRWKRNPVFEVETVQDMVRSGLKRLASMQLPDGGWGWFSGWQERSTPHTTATVVHGLQVARANGAEPLPGMLERGLSWLEDYQREELAKLRNAETGTDPWKAHADNLDALVHMVLADGGRADRAMADFLYRDRTRLSVYAMAMLGLALHQAERTTDRDMVMRNIEQYLVEDEENQTAWLELPGDGWWYWYGSEYEAHAYYLKLLARTAPKSRRAAGLVKYLLNNRKNATYWNSTRDTALCVEAMADYLRASGEDRPDMTLQIMVDGRLRKEVRITPENLFAFENALVLTGRALSAGEHTVELRRQGRGPVYFNAYMTNFTLEDFISAEGLEIKAERSYYRLRPAAKSVMVSGARGQALSQRVEKYERERLENLSLLESGDLVEIELTIESKNDYEYVVLEDMKGAGFEPVGVRSGYGENEMGAYMELRDERVVFFIRSLARGTHSLSYRARAEIPGRFSVLPLRAHAMYAPELRANSNEVKLRIED